MYRDAKFEDLAPELQKELDIDGGILLWGPVGIGKTHTMFAVMRRCVAKGLRVLRTKYDMLCLEIRSTYADAAGQTEKSIIHKYQRVDVLWIEDVGTTISAGEQESDFSLRVFLMVIDHRLEHLLPTYVTTNKDPQELGSSFDERIMSRLRQACKIIALKGKDKRARPRRI